LFKIVGSHAPAPHPRPTTTNTPPPRRQAVQQAPFLPSPALPVFVVRDSRRPQPSLFLTKFPRPNACPPTVAPKTSLGKGFYHQVFPVTAPNLFFPVSPPVPHSVKSVLYASPCTNFRGNFPKIGGPNERIVPPPPENSDMTPPESVFRVC